MDKKITGVYFSPSGRSKNVLDIAMLEFSGDKEYIDLFKKEELGNHTYDKEDMVIINLPVFAGRIPNVAKEKLNNIKGDNTLAIAMVSYGNRDYDDALLELTDLLKEQGFTIVGAGAFITRHSIFPEVAKNRPDDNDNKIIKDFINKCKNKINNRRFNEITVKGNRPYKESKLIPLMPTGDENCIECGECVEICPKDAISIEEPRKTDKEKCINCTACIYTCPNGSRGYHSPMYKVANAKFKFDNRKRKEPEIFM